MNKMGKALAVMLVAAAGASGLMAAAWAKTAPVPKLKIIKVSARRFEFTPKNLVLKKGQTVDVELTTEDVLMGFNVPDLGKRTNIVPGETTHLQLTPQKVGTITFLCDIFCGSGHEGMDGTITVVE